MTRVQAAMVSPSWPRQTSVSWAAAAVPKASAASAAQTSFQARDALGSMTIPHVQARDVHARRRRKNTAGPMGTQVSRPRLAAATRRAMRRLRALSHESVLDRGQHLQHVGRIPAAEPDKIATGKNRQRHGCCAYHLGALVHLPVKRA